jgi:AraC-like DNA-binding protein
MARRDVAFDAEGVMLRGWFYPAEGGSGLAPAIVMAHGFSAVKEMYLDSFAEVFGAVVRQRRLDHARQELDSSDETVSSIAARWGFADASHLSRSFKYAFGMSPRDYRAARTVAEQPDRARRQ